MKLRRSTQLKVNFVQISYRTGTRFNPQEKVSHCEDEKENIDKIERAGIFSQETLVNVHDNEQHRVTTQPSVTTQPKLRAGKQHNKKISFFGWRGQADEMSDEEDKVLAERLVEK